MIGTKNIFEGKASRIVRILLVNWPKKWNLRDLAKEANVTLGTAQKVANTLLKENYAIRERRRAEFKLMNPLRLLRRWGAYNDFSTRHEFVRYYTFEQEIGRFLEQIKSKQGPQYALTTLVGALQVAPYVRATDVYLYVSSKDDAKKWAELLELKPVEREGNIIFVIPDDNYVFYGMQTINGVNVISNVQLYVDLFNYAGRGEEAADALIKKMEKDWAKVRA